MGNIRKLEDSHTQTMHPFTYSTMVIRIHIDRNRGILLASVYWKRHLAMTQDAERCLCYRSAEKVTVPVQNFTEEVAVQFSFQW